MKEKHSSKKTSLILLVIAVAGALIYFYSSGTPDDASISSLESELTPEASEAQLAGARVLSLLDQISALKIDPSIFNTTAYQSLIDYTIAIPEQNIGRPNPFAPIGR